MSRDQWQQSMDLRSMDPQMMTGETWSGGRLRPPVAAAGNAFASRGAAPGRGRPGLHPTWRTCIL
ncbi:MAG: hypothetical protein WA474_12305, partial [Candidatus Sulfotelmatobacter sp.]